MKKFNVLRVAWVEVKTERIGFWVSRLGKKKKNEKVRVESIRAVYWSVFFIFFL
jgi:hypothetical protein